MLKERGAAFLERHYSVHAAYRLSSYSERPAGGGEVTGSSKESCKQKILSYVLRLGPAVPALAAFQHSHKIPVDTVLGHKLLRGSWLGNLDVGNHKNLVGSPDGVKAMGADQQGFSFAKLIVGLHGVNVKASMLMRLMS